MASLTETAFYARKVIKWGAIGLIIFTILRLLISALISAIISSLPPPALKPNYAFGKLPKLSFPQGASPTAELSYRLQTIEGTVPEASDAARVFFLPKNRVNLLSLSAAQTFAARLGFTQTPEQLQDTLYRWIDPKNALRSLDMDIVSKNFTLNYSYANDLTLSTDRQVPTQRDALKQATNFLQNSGLNPTDVDLANPRVTFLKLTGNQLQPTTSQSQADAIRLDFYRKPVAGMSLINDVPQIGNIAFIISGSRRIDSQILYVKYVYWPLDQQAQAVYQLKRTQTAWEELQAGKGYVASINPNDHEAVITNLSLVYYDSEAPQLFLQPVFVFSGERDFVAYVSAIAAPWTE